MESWFAMQTLVRCLQVAPFIFNFIFLDYNNKKQGTLLGLYPNCLKAIAFGARVELLRFIRTLLVLPFEKLHMFMQRIPYIIKLGVMEHLCNTIYDYHPGICHTLNRSGQKVEHFCNSVSTICDIFRGELNTLYCAAAQQKKEHGAAATGYSSSTILDIMMRLEKIAHSYFERCTRAYRGIIVGNMQPVRSVDQARRLLFASAPTITENTSRTSITMVLQHILEKVHSACNQSVFDVTHAKILPNPAVRELAWYMMQSIQVKMLPLCIAERQLEALKRRYHGDTTCIQQCRILHVCVQCVIRKGTVQVLCLYFC